MLFRSLAGAAAGAALARSGRAAPAPSPLEIGGAAIQIDLESAQFDLPEAALLDWVKQAARAVTSYYGRFPVPHARVKILAHHGRGVHGGESFGDGGVWCRLSVGSHATQGDLDRDWTMTHEMVHFAFPSVPDRHHWIEEGLATYVEPIARASAGNLTPRQVWGDMARDMWQGLPEQGDQGLDHTHTWGRTYWGGALYCLLADIEIRKNTANAKGLPDALRAINRAGGSIEVDWPLERALQVGDHAADGKTLSKLYLDMRAKPVMVDLPDLWKRLGVVRRDGEVTFDDSAPLAKIRHAITPEQHAPSATRLPRDTATAG